MATPKKRKSLTRRLRARAQDKILLPTLTKCSNCQSYKKPHHVCHVCGYYKGAQILTIKVKKENTKE